MASVAADITIDKPIQGDGAVGHLVRPAHAWARCAHCAAELSSHRNSVNETHEALVRHLREVHSIIEPVIEDRIPQ